MFRKNYPGILIIILYLLIILSGCNRSTEKENKSTLYITASTSIIADVVSNITGDKAEVFTLVDTDPHTFEPSPKDMSKIEESDIIFINGFGLEENLLEIFYINAKGEIIEVSDGIKPIIAESRHANENSEEELSIEHDKAREEEHFSGNIDPHTWTSPLNIIIWVENISNALTRIDNSNAAYYKEQSENYINKLYKLNEYIEDRIKTIPESKRIIVSDHDFLEYFARDYNFNIIGTLIPSVSTLAEPSPGDISELIELIRTYHVNVIFLGNTTGESIETLSSVISNELDTKINIKTILTGMLGESGTEGDTYIGYIKYNIEQIAKGLKE